VGNFYAEAPFLISLKSFVQSFQINASGVVSIPANSSSPKSSRGSKCKTVTGVFGHAEMIGILNSTFDSWKPHLSPHLYGWEECVSVAAHLFLR
jgi:hypothetical protein